jgi:5'-nucleotidase (lipoprotein e(P4) family)
MIRLRLQALCALAALIVSAAPAMAEDPPQNDLLNATLWMQRSVEFKATALAGFALAQVRLEQALADKSWTAAPGEQTGNYQDLPPAVILDIDETLLDNSGYQVWMVLNNTTFSPQTWNQFVKDEVATPIPGAVEFSKFAESKGVKVFYISNRTGEEEEATRRNMERYGFPMGGNVDTFLMARERPDWTSAKSTRRAHVAKDYRVLLNMGDNFGDFHDGYRGNEAERLKVYEENKARWGREWIMIANPAYGSFESAPFGHDYKQSRDAQRAAKRGALQPWKGPSAQ